MRLSITFTNIFLLSYDVCTAETYSLLLTCGGTRTDRKNDHNHLDSSHTDAQAGLCSLQTIVSTDALTAIFGFFL